jgi:hypothetical protein
VETIDQAFVVFTVSRKMPFSFYRWRRKGDSCLPVLFVCNPETQRDNLLYSGTWVSHLDWKTISSQPSLSTKGLILLCFQVFLFFFFFHRNK